MSGWPFVIVFWYLVNTRVRLWRRRQPFLCQHTDRLINNLLLRCGRFSEQIISWAVTAAFINPVKPQRNWRKKRLLPLKRDRIGCWIAVTDYLFMFAFSRYGSDRTWLRLNQLSPRINPEYEVLIVQIYNLNIFFKNRMDVPCGSLLVSCECPTHISALTSTQNKIQ